MKKNVPLYKIPLATATHAGKVVLFSKIKSTKPFHAPNKKIKVVDEEKIIYNTSRDGTSFSTTDTAVRIFKGKKEVDAERIISFKIFTTSDKKPEYWMTVEIVDDKGNVGIMTAFSKNMKKWLIQASSIPVPFAKQAVFVPKTAGRSKNVVYYSDREIWAKVRKTGKQFDAAHIIVNPRIDKFDSQPLEGMAFIPEKEGLFIVYSSQAFSGNSVDMSVGAFVSSGRESGKVLWRSETPLWQGHFDKAEYLVPIGGQMLKKNIFLYWMDIKGELIVVKLQRAVSIPFKPPEIIRAKGPLRRSPKNPIIEPRQGHDWEADGTFNPAAFMDDEGYIHLLYRAIGRDGISRIGYARSADGIHFSRRSSGPVFEPSPGYGLPHPGHISGPAEYNPLFYTSGGSWGGSEDPRAVKIRGKVYMMYVAFEGWNSIRIALTSIAENDLKNGHWKWKKPVLISPSGETNKNWLLFPEKVNGKYAILHSVVPKVLIAYVDSLEDFDGTYHISSPRPEGPQPGRVGYWDSLIRGAGPPPIRTSAGWLLLYHALDKNDSGRYKLGAMILDTKDPTKILYRSSNPLLSPDMSYENEGKPGVVYASGAVVKGDNLYIYYGGGDRVVCVAVSPVHDFLEYIKEGKAPQLAFSRVNLN